MVGDYSLVRRVTVPRPVEGGHYATWLRHGQVMSARLATEEGDEDNILDLAAGVLARNPAFGQTEDSNGERLRRLCQFDQLALLIIADVRPEATMPYYPSYAKYPESYVEDAVVGLREPGPARSEVFPKSDSELRAVLRNGNELALIQAALVRHAGRRWRYAGFQDRGPSCSFETGRAGRTLQTSRGVGSGEQPPCTTSSRNASHSRATLDRYGHLDACAKRKQLACRIGLPRQAASQPARA